MKEFDKEEDDESSYYSYEEVHLGVFHTEPKFAELRTSTYPDGSVRNQLQPDELRELARMLEDAADELED